MILNMLMLIGTTTCVLAVGFLLRKLVFKRLPLSPGPKPYPIIGNMLDMPKEYAWMAFSRWKKLHGDMIYLTVLGRKFLVVNSLETAAYFLERRSSIYSGRMRFVFSGELCAHNRSLAFKDGTSHRQARKFAHRSLSSTAIKQRHGLQEDEAHKILRRLLDDPTEFVRHFHTTAQSIIMRILYGYEVGEHDDPLIQAANKVLAAFEVAAVPGRWLVDAVPMLKHIPAWVPGAGFQRQAKIWRDQVEEMFHLPFNLVKKRVAEGNALSSMTSQLLESKKNQSDEESIMNAVGSLYGGAVDTTPAAMSSFVLAMTLYLEVQRKAQEELDRVVGRDRLPRFADRSNLPYINALVKEVHRWAPVIPLGIPHRLIKEDVYNGYRIPKDTIIILNIWRINRDIHTYGSDSDTFRPERFLGSDPAPRGFTTANTQEFGSTSFGFGRRVCSGQHVADPSMFIVFSNVLATMDISPRAGANGKPVLPEIKFTTGVISHPKPFQCCITPRSALAIDLIRDAD
ncbi:cytochrome P450 [Dacryopinax primogenitus]|uniref:Cytochrome P450 n=1 Tax=Dacryopinax primogenitus (strain DJM 731) TaxID=1858805 RepID=M5FQV1_DACPD|nr:cytochrome P450 [Dacryopinax primogenitus]EJT97963.1 cytochrome P450 [Dacryopinax primogenitus]